MQNPNVEYQLNILKSHSVFLCLVPLVFHVFYDPIYYKGEKSSHLAENSLGSRLLNLLFLILLTLIINPVIKSSRLRNPVVEDGINVDMSEGIEMVELGSGIEGEGLDGYGMVNVSSADDSLNSQQPQLLLSRQFERVLQK